MVDFEEGGKLLNVGFGGLGLAVEDCGYRDFGAAEFCSDSFEREIFLFLAFEKGW
jgi:hypothetical protein